ncbi:MAG TPA: hypothetical protein PKA11_08165 [Accumulibacter sp.]|nr:hypothetical protein [Accumulibacter sp.]
MVGFIAKTVMQKFMGF